jgi:MFS family permease
MPTVICGHRLFVRDHPHEKGYQDFIVHNADVGDHSIKGIFFGIMAVCRYPNTILLCIVPGGIVGCVLTFSGLWGVPYLTTHYGLPTTQAAALTSALLVAWAAGGPFFGWFSDRIGSRKPLYIIGCTATLAGWSGIIFVTNLPVYGLLLLLIATGFSSGAMIIGFAFARESVPVHLAGTVSGVVNMGVMMGPMLLQPAVGWVLDKKWEGVLAQGIRVYPLKAYQAGFALMLAWAGLALLLLFLTRETQCRQQV